MNAAGWARQGQPRLRLQRISKATCALLMGSLGSNIACGWTPASTDRAALSDLLPTESQEVWKSADHLINAGNAIIQRAAELDAHGGMGVDRQLVALGGALQETAMALKRLQPLLLPVRVSLRQVLEKDPEAIQSMAKIVNYRSELDHIAAAGRDLAALDPIGSDGPSRSSGETMAAAGAALVDLGETSGIGLHLRHVGDMLSTIREAQLRHDPSVGLKAIRTLGDMTLLAGYSLAGSACVATENDAVNLIGGGIFVLGDDLSHAALEHLDRALAVCEMGFREHAVSLTVRARVTRRLDLPGTAAVYNEQFRGAATTLDSQAQIPMAAAQVVVRARSLLRPGKQPGPVAEAGVAMEAAGSALMNGQCPESIQAAGRIMAETGSKLRSAEPVDVLEILRHAALQLQVGPKLAPASP